MAGLTSPTPCALPHSGEKQVNLTFEEFRVTEEQAIEIQPAKLEIVDLRLQPSTFKLQPSIQVWAEGADRAKGRSCFDLQQADELAIHTTPPSPADLKSVLQIVKPIKVYVLGISPAPQKTDEFLSQLAGMAKFAINNKGRKVSINDLAVAAAQRVSAVRIGLEWLAAGGHATIVPEGEALVLSAGSGEANQYLQKELFVAVKGILEETAAYRAYFAAAAVEHLVRVE